MFLFIEKLQPLLNTNNLRIKREGIFLKVTIKKGQKVLKLIIGDNKIQSFFYKEKKTFLETEIKKVANYINNKLG